MSRTYLVIDLIKSVAMIAAAFLLLADLRGPALAVVLLALVGEVIQSGPWWDIRVIRTRRTR